MDVVFPDHLISKEIRKVIYTTDSMNRLPDSPQNETAVRRLGSTRITKTECPSHDTVSYTKSVTDPFATDSTACLINETAVRRLGWDNAVGRTFRITMLSDYYPPYEVIGVMADFHNQSLHQPIEPLLVLFSTVVGSVSWS